MDIHKELRNREGPNLADMEIIIGHKLFLLEFLIFFIYSISTFQLDFNHFVFISFGKL